MPSRCRNPGRCRSRVDRTPSPYRCLYRTISCFVVLLLLGLAGFIVGMVNYFVPPTEHPVTAFPLDTRLLPFDAGDCGDLEVLMDPNNSTQMKVDLFILSRKPDASLGAIIHENTKYSLSKQNPLKSYYRYYLVAGSSIHVSLTTEGLPAYRSELVWIFASSDTDTCGADLCSFDQEYLSCTRTIDIRKDGLYDISLRFVGESDYVSGNINIAVNKFIYKVDQAKILAQCSAPCSKELKWYSEYSLVTTSNVSDTVGWSDEVDYKWLCSNIRAVGLWVDLVMLMGMLLMMVSTGFIVGLSVVLCIKKRTQNDEETEPLISQSSDSPLPTLIEPPPQYTKTPANPLLSLSNPPPYTESADQQNEGATHP